MNDRNKLVSGCVLLVLLLGLALIVQLSGPKCALLDKPPEEEPRMRPSQDFRDLVTFSGYLKYNLAHSNGTEYLAISLDSMKVERPAPESQHNRIVVLRDECAKLTLIIDLIEDKRQIARIVVESKHHLNALPHVTHKECWIDSPGISLLRGSHYECDRRKLYNCKNPADHDEEVKAALILDKFELELDGIEEFIRENRFSSPARGCS